MGAGSIWRAREQARRRGGADCRRHDPVGCWRVTMRTVDINMGKLLGQWFVYSLVIAVIAAYIAGRTRRSAGCGRAS
jgi:hypothetical protein